MAATIPYEGKIAVGNDNAAGLTLITSLTASSIPFVQTMELNTRSYVRGEPRTSTSGLNRHAGYPSKEWLSSVLWLAQWEYLVTTYEGAVTFRTRLTGASYANYNAVLRVGDWGENGVIMESKYGSAMIDFKWMFTRVRAI